MPGVFDVQNIFDNYMSNLSNKEIPFSETTLWNCTNPVSI